MKEAPPEEAQRSAEVALTASEAGQSPSALIALRRATAQSHVAIDRLLGIDAYLERARYVRILAAFDGFYEVWEPRIEAALPEPWATWFLARSRRSFLERDMAALGARPLALPACLADRLQFDAAAAGAGAVNDSGARAHAAADFEPDAGAGPDVGAAVDRAAAACAHAAAFGSMYVMEGSSLGGRLISERVAQALGITPANGGAYFAGWGADTGRLWREFRQVLELQLGRPESIRLACESAVDTFDVLINVFSEALDDRTC